MLELDDALDPSELNAVFNALSDERRRDMVVRLSRQPMTVSELAGPAGMRLPSATKHLAVLESGGIVVSKKIGRTRTYRSSRSAFNAIAAWIEQRRTGAGYRSKATLRARRGARDLAYKIVIFIRGLRA